MMIYHQCGHNFIWNVESLRDDRSGAGLIISPVNVDADRISDRVPEGIRSASWIDPQFYLPDNAKGKLPSYPFFPGNVMDRFVTTDFEACAFEIAKACLEFQDRLGCRYLVVPTRYFDDLPENYLEQVDSLFVEPFLEAKQELQLNRPVLLTVIAKPLHIEAGIQRDELLSWATRYDAVSGIYLIFDNNFYSKQIKDPGHLAGALRFIRALRQNDLEVHVGYSSLEGLLFSAADATSVSVGSYENLRSFSTLRLEIREPSPRRGPQPRIYSARLLQSIEATYLPALRQLTPGWRDFFDESPYKEYLLNPANSLNFQRSEIYKHYFFLFSRQVAALPVLADRSEHLRHRVMEAMERFESIRASRVVLDSDSDGSHLPAWLNALAMFDDQPE